jgi:hypothetical protein
VRPVNIIYSRCIIQLKIINSIMILRPISRVIFFQEVTVLVMKGFVHHLNHACRQAILRYAVFWWEIHPFNGVTIRHRSHDWLCYRGVPLYLLRFYHVMCLSQFCDWWHSFTEKYLLLPYHSGWVPTSARIGSPRPGIFP